MICEVMILIGSAANSPRTDIWRFLVGHNNLPMVYISLQIAYDCFPSLATRNAQPVPKDKGKPIATHPDVVLEKLLPIFAATT